MKVHSNKKHKPRYWVTRMYGKKMLFGSESGSEALQWAIDQVAKEKVLK